MLEDRLPSRPHDGPVGMVRSIDADDDAAAVAPGLETVMNGCVHLSTMALVGVPGNGPRSLGVGTMGPDAFTRNR